MKKEIKNISRSDLSPAIFRFIYKTSDLIRFVVIFSENAGSLAPQYTPASFTTSYGATIPHSEEFIRKQEKELKKNLELQVCQSGILILFSILEHCFEDICTILKSQEDLRISWTELKGSPLKRFRSYCEKILDADLGISETAWQFVNDLYLLRNIYAHEFRRFDEKDQNLVNRLASRSTGISILDHEIIVDYQFISFLLGEVQTIFKDALWRLLTQSVSHPPEP